MALTIRNNEPEFNEFNNQLNSLKKKIGMNTATKVIQHVVLDYANKCEELERAMVLLVQNEKIIRDLQKIVGRIKRIERDMLTTLEGKELNDSDAQLSFSFMENKSGEEINDYNRRK